MCTVSAHTLTHAHTLAATEPLYILMEFAMYGSLKDYLKSVKNGKLPNPQLLLNQQQVLLGHTPAPPPHSPRLLQVSNGNAAMASEMTSSAYPATNQTSTFNLCPYHHNQLTQFNNMTSSAPTGGSPDNQHHLRACVGARADDSVSLYDVDPTSKAHATRLLKLLNSEYCLRQLMEDHDCCHGDEEEGEGGATIKSGQSAYSYRRLGESCVQRPCLDDYPYWYGTLPRNTYYNSYYNCSEHKREHSESSLADTPGTNAPLLPPPPIYVNVYEGEDDTISSNDPHHQECVCHQQECMCRQPSPGLNPYHNLSSSSTCVYCCQCVSGEAVGDVPRQQTGTGDQASLEGTGNVYSESENTLSYFEVLDFAQQIARGMEHLEKMKVTHLSISVICLIATRLSCLKPQTPPQATPIYLSSYCSLELWETTLAKQFEQRWSSTASFEPDSSLL